MWFFTKKKKGKKNSGKKWTEEDERILLKGVLEEASFDDIGKILGRESSAVSIKYNQINNKRRSGSWSQEESQILIGLWNKGATLEEIGQELNRKRNSILGKLNSFSSWGYPKKINSNLHVGKTSKGSELIFDLGKAINDFQKNNFQTTLKSSNESELKFDTSGNIEITHDKNKSSKELVKKYALKGYEIEHISEQTNISEEEVNRLMDEIGIWDQYDSIMLNKAEKRWNKQPKLGIEKNLFEQRLIKREEEENKAIKYVKRLISTPEGTQVEFKETFWRCVNTKQNDKQDVIHSAIKNINAFFNTRGGDLVIGVNDKTREIVGIEFDQFKNDEEYTKKIRLRIQNVMKPHIVTLYDVDIVEIDAKKICLIHVEKSDKPIFLLDKKYKNSEVFYVREGESAFEYEGRKLVDYIQRNFASKEE